MPRAWVRIHLVVIAGGLRPLRSDLHHCDSREKWRKCISVVGSLRGQAKVRPIDKLDEAYTNADDWVMLVQHCSGDRLMS